MTIKPRIKHTYRLPADLTRQLADLARTKRVPQVSIVEAALASFLSPDGADRLEAALSRRLDRMTRQADRLEWNVDLTNETLTQFIRFWLINNPPPPGGTTDAMRALGKERWDGFLRSLAERVESGLRLSRDIGGKAANDAD
jgi:hypothetical protein